MCNIYIYIHILTYKLLCVCSYVVHRYDIVTSRSVHIYIYISDHNIYLYICIQHTCTYPVHPCKPLRPESNTDMAKQVFCFASIQVPHGRTETTRGSLNREVCSERLCNWAAGKKTPQVYPTSVSVSLPSR